VLHFNHRLRGGESDADARFVEELAGNLGFEVEIGEGDIRRIARVERGNLEQVARRERYRFFQGFLDSGALDRIALGHTRSDQAETVLYRLLRGSGTAGLAGVRPSVGAIVRPLIRLERREIEDYLRKHAISWREDSSNQDLQFDRNRIRHELLPRLEKDWNPSLEEVLARMANVAQDEEAYWDAELDRIEAEFLAFEAPAALLDCTRLQSLPRAVARRGIRRAMERVKGDLSGVGARHVEAVLELAATGRGEGRVEAPGLAALRSFSAIRMAPPASWADRPPFAIRAKVPGKHPLPNDKSVICLELASEVDGGPPEIGGYNMREGHTLDRRRVTGELELRNWRPGDRYCPVGQKHGQKVKALFQKERVPSWDRSGWPILTDGGAIVWARQFGVAEGYAAGPGCGEMIRITEIVPGARR